MLRNNSRREVEILAVSGESFRGEQPKGCGQARIDFKPAEQRKDPYHYTPACVYLCLYVFSSFFFLLAW